MDDLLASNPAAFRMLRAFWKLSFIKFDDEENQAFRDALLRANEAALAGDDPSTYFPSDWVQGHQDLRHRLGHQHRLTVEPLLTACGDGERLAHEMAIEAGVLAQLSTPDPSTVDILGRWDYLHHQVPASPFKPIDYMDRMDVFGYRFIEGFSPTRSRYLVAEIKKDTGFVSDVEQLMKYVDWVKDEYASGDYGMITAFLIANDFDSVSVAQCRDLSKRRFIVGRRPAESREWSQLQLVRYRFDSDSAKIRFEVVGPSAAG